MTRHFCSKARLPREGCDRGDANRNLQHRDCEKAASKEVPLTLQLALIFCKARDCGVFRQGSDCDCASDCCDADPKHAWHGSQTVAARGKAPDGATDCA